MSRGLIASLVIMGLMMLDAATHRGTLVTQADTQVRALFMLLGFAAGVWFVWEAIQSGRLAGADTRSRFGIVMLPIFTMILGSYVARRAQEAQDFLGVDTPWTTTAALVTSKRSKWPYKAHAIAIPDGRELDIAVGHDLWLQLPAVTTGDDCIVIKIQRGRRGTIRTRLPVLQDKPLGLENYASCPDWPDWPVKVGAGL